jgi:hypothetical protein
MTMQSWFLEQILILARSAPTLALRLPQQLACKEDLGTLPSGVNAPPSQQLQRNAMQNFAHCKQPHLAPTPTLDPFAKATIAIGQTLIVRYM